MAATRKGPRMIQEIQRLKSLGLGKKTVARALGISRNTVKQYWELGAQSGATAERSATVELQTTAAETSVAVARPRYEAPWAGRVDWPAVKQAVDAGEALAVWLEDRQREGGEGSALRGVPYTSFWREFKRRYAEVPLDFHKTHPPGERIEFDYKGQRPGFGYTDVQSGRFVLCEMFGAVLCFSQLLYIEASPSQQKAEFLGSLERAFAAFGGVTPLLTGDNLKSAVSRAHRYDPDLNPDFAAFCGHYGTVPLPARPRKPKDKNLIEGALGVFWRWIRAKLAQRRFYSLAELNAWIGQMLQTFNARVQRKYGMSRREKFISGERALLKPLPATPYELCEWRSAKLHWDCFAQVGKNFYSAPYALRGEELSVRLTPAHVEFYFNLERVALHRRLPANQQGRYVREDQHLPPAHKALLEMVPQRCLENAAAIGPETHRLVERLLTRAPHPLTYLRRVLGILRLKSRYSAAALERACTTINALPQAHPRLQTVEGVLKTQACGDTHRVPLPPVQRRPNPNLRGQSHWLRPADQHALVQPLPGVNPSQEQPR